jgi:hypothetical protein
VNPNDIAKLVFLTADCISQLEEEGVLRSTEDIPLAYAKWFCAQHLSIELVSHESQQTSYDAISKFGEHIQIIKKLGSDTNFSATFSDVRLKSIDYLLVVFMEEKNWQIKSIYQISRDTLSDFICDDQTLIRWCGELRSLSVQVYPVDENTLFL